MRKVPEQAILAEVRRMVEEMQTLNKKLEETVRYSFFFRMDFILETFLLRFSVPEENHVVVFIRKP